jgi:hypothetical protein
LNTKLIIRVKAEKTQHSNHYFSHAGPVLAGNDRSFHRAGKRSVPPIRLLVRHPRFLVHREGESHPTRTGSTMCLDKPPHVRLGRMWDAEPYNRGNDYIIGGYRVGFDLPLTMRSLFFVHNGTSAPLVAKPFLQFSLALNISLLFYPT